MARTFRWLLRIFIALSALSLGAAGLAYYLAGRSLPDYGRDYIVTGTLGEVEIVRDNHSVPHIFADRERDVFFGLGFVHAQDRLWQMMLLRRTAQGRLSEIFGDRTIAIDDFLRRLDLYRLAESSVGVQGPAEQMALQAYADGVNAWVETTRTEAMGRGAPEFFLFAGGIQPWQPADSLAILKLMSLRLSGHLSDEVLRARTSLALGESAARLGDILPDAPGPGIAALPPYAALAPGLMRHAAASQPRDSLDPVPGYGAAGASNAWAASVGRSASQGTLLANDPHLPFSAPSIWMLARLQLDSGDVIGGTIPGIPAVLTGRSDVLGWGLTASYLDDQDLHIEKLNPDNPDEYLTPEGYRAFRSEQISIALKGGGTLSRTLRWTENGPVLDGALHDLGAITPEGHVMSLSWTALDPGDTSMTAALRLMRARSVEDAIEAGSLYIAPAMNLTLADRTSIAFQMIGRMANRQARHQSRGRLPTPGWLMENRWLGYLPYENNPRFTDPLGGIVANTNNKIVDWPFPYHVSYSWGDTQRIERLKKLMGNREVHTRASFIEAQLDQVSFTARALLPLVARDLWFAADVPISGTPESLRQNALALLAEWNGEMNEHLPEPLIFNAWMRALQLRLIQDELGPLAREFTHADPVFLERVFRDVDGAAIWCDVVQSTPRETCTEIARNALDIALAGLVRSYGERIESWRWGDAHQATHDHEALGAIPLLGWFVNIRQSTSGGDNTLLRGQTKGTGDNPYLNVHGAGYRGVYDFADPDSSVFIIATGQSGHFLSRHYDDLAQLWRRGEYIPMSLDPDLARAASVGISHLRPKRN
ncbi:MAG: penicillin acylase family protein [Rhodobacteraceae bacterium]|nr:penicillin acylase family protein [Paracoccaceae bacterium]